MIEGWVPKGLYRWTEKYAAPDTSDVTREGPIVKRGQIVVLHQLSVVEYTTADKSLLVGFKDAGGNAHYVSHDKGTSKYEAKMRGQMTLTENEKPIGTVLSPTANDVLYFSAFGVVYELPEQGA